MSHNSIYTARDAKNRFGEMLDSVHRAPVHITKNGREVAVLMSREEFEVFEKLEDLVWSARAREAESEGYLSAKESEAYINSILNADAET